MLTRRSAITGYRLSSPRAARRWHHRGTHRMVSARTCSRPSYACAPQSQRPTRHRTRLRLLPVDDAATECALACGGHAACVSQFLRFVAVDYSATVDPVRRIVYAELAIEAQDVGLPRCALGRGGPDCKAYVTTSISSSFVVLPPTWPSGRVFDYVSRAPGPPLALCRTEHCVLSALRPHAMLRPGAAESDAHPAAADRHLLPIRVPGHDCWHHIRRSTAPRGRRARRFTALHVRRRARSRRRPRRGCRARRIGPRGGQGCVKENHHGGQ